LRVITDVAKLFRGGQGTNIPLCRASRLAGGLPSVYAFQILSYCPGPDVMVDTSAPDRRPPGVIRRKEGVLPCILQ
jgi:hypothetical protein